MEACPGNAGSRIPKMYFICIHLASLLVGILAAKERSYDFKVHYKQVTHLGVTKSLVAVNNLFPGPTVYANEGERILVNVTNNVDYNISIHWHGVRQILSAWADGPAYITQCPLSKGQSYLYNFTLKGQTGTLFWHAHATWLRATVYGAIVIYPSNGVPYPFKYPHDEHVILLGEWWNDNIENVELQMLQSGLPPPSADAYTINGLPGSCDTDSFRMRVHPGVTYLLRIVNAALNMEFYFTIAKHTLLLVEVDGEYVKPHRSEVIMLTPGQSANVLLTTDQDIGEYAVEAGPYISVTLPGITFQNASTAFLQYIGSELSPSPPFSAQKFRTMDTPYAERLSLHIRALNNRSSVPLTIDKSLFLTIGLGLLPCSTCPSGAVRLASSMNNVSFVLPHSVSLLQAHYFNLSNVFTRDFPEQPRSKFDYTSPLQKGSTMTTRGTKVSVVPYNSNVEIVFQDTSFIGIENHPIHLHGYSFYVIGKGFGNFDPETAKFNLHDPPYRNTLGVPSGGWAAIRFKADNPGVWYMHCHLEVHTTWGLAMAFLVTNGEGPDQTLPPPPADLPKC